MRCLKCNRFYLMTLNKRGCPYCTPNALQWAPYQEPIPQRPNPQVASHVASSPVFDPFSAPQAPSMDLYPSARIGGGEFSGAGASSNWDSPSSCSSSNSDSSSSTYDSGSSSSYDSGSCSSGSDY